MKILLVSMLIVAVSGCSTTAAMISTGVNTAASITTGKGFIDNTLSAIKNKDCRTHRLFKGEEICKEDE